MDSKIYVDNVTVPRALLVLCQDVLNRLEPHVRCGLSEDYDLAVAQLRAALE